MLMNLATAAAIGLVVDGLANAVTGRNSRVARLREHLAVFVAVPTRRRGG
jgi:hypothetical protein